MYRLGEARAEISKLIGRLDSLERSEQSIPVREETIPAAARKMPTPERVSIYEPKEPAKQSTQAPAKAVAPEPDVVVHERTPVEPAEPSTLEHLLEVAKRWLTTGNVPVKVGIIISFIGVSFLLKYAIDNAIRTSTGREGSDTVPDIANARVTEWAKVKAVTCQNRGFQRVLSRKRPSTKRIWSSPFGSM